MQGAEVPTQGLSDLVQPELQSDFYINTSFDNQDTGSAEIVDTLPCEYPSDFCTYTSIDNLDINSAAGNSDTIPYAYSSDFCTYTSFDNLDTNSAAVNDATPMGPERTLCKFFQNNPCVETIQISDILQCDGTDTISEKSINDSMNSYNSQDEADADPVRATLVPSEVQGPPGAPLTLEVDLGGEVQLPSYVPLCAVTNPRSGWNKIHNIRTFLHQVGPDFMILSEHWGRKKLFQNALASQHYKVIESSRGIRGIPTRGRNGTKTVSVTGGGVAILYNEKNFFVEDAGIEAPEGIEAVWIILTPKERGSPSVKKILVGGIYIAPRSLFKQETVDHIIQSMFCVQSRYDSQVRFLISGDFNKVNIEDILESNGALQQVCNVATRNDSTLELVITDMATLLHPPTTLDPINQDKNTKGKPSDHNVIVVAPRTDVNFRIERHKRKVHLRPLPESKMSRYMRDMGSHVWEDVYNCDSPHEKAEVFHKTLLHKINKHLPEKTVKMTSLDKNWFNPAVKLKYCEMQKEFFKHGKSTKWRKLRSIFRKAKKKASTSFFSDFVSDLKVTKPGQYFKMAKRIGGIEQQGQGELYIECLDGMDPQEQVEAVAASFAKVSCEFEPINLSKLPAYLPAQEAPQISVYNVYKKIQGQKKTRSTLPIDIPHNVRKEAAEFLAEPLTDIFNSCLRDGKYPKIWKQEYVTPVPKTKQNKIIKRLKDVRKIASTSDYSKIFEHFLIKFINEDISDMLSKTQYGGKKGIGTEHLLINMIDRIKQLQDDPEKIVVVLNSYDWNAAFDKLDPTEVTLKCIKLGVRSSIINVLIDFMRERKMVVKMNQQTSSSHDLIGGSPQGSLIGQLLYIIGSDDVAEDVKEEDKFKYIDDLAVLDAINVKGKLTDYDVWQHVPSDIAIEEQFLAASAGKSQEINDNIAAWTISNKMKINEEKSKYMVLSKCKDKFATRLTINSKTLDRAQEMVHLGVWLTEDMSWNKHVSEMCRRAYPRVKMLSKLKYVGISTEDLIILYCLLIRSLTEYCSVVFHSSLTLRLKKTKLKLFKKPASG